MEPSRTPSLFPLETCPPVTDEAFNLFHSIDRELYTLLIRNLRREPGESMQVVAFWIWLEREGNDMKLIRRIMSLPPALLNELADEAVACLKCVENDRFLFGNGNEITLLPDLLSTRVSLRFFHENRIAVLRGVTKIINTVCTRAFNDILQRFLQENAAIYAVAPGGSGGGGTRREVGESSRAAEKRNEGREDHTVGGMAAPSPPVMPMFYHPHLNIPFFPVHPGSDDGFVRMPPPPIAPPAGHPHPPMMADAIGIPFHMLTTGGFPGAAYDFEMQRQMLNNELGEMLNRSLMMEINSYHEEDVIPDDRTIFLTFSKGYPITEDEVRDFFTRRFGDFIEELIMQEVAEDEQVLYARMVARSTAVIDIIVGGNKAKYSINGKHVWARKYVKKQQSSSSIPRTGDHSPTHPGQGGSSLFIPN